jgi:hypothetical protein
MHFEQEINDTIIVSELDQIPLQTSIPEQPIQNVEVTPEPQIPNFEQCDDIPSDNQEHHIPQTPVQIETIDNDTPPSSCPSSPIPFGPAYKPLTMDEIIIPSDQMLPLMENIIMQSVDIDDSSDEPPSLYPYINLSKLKIKPLKRKKPEPTIPFSRAQPFFNPVSEPNLELLNIAINISLKRLKSM